MADTKFWASERVEGVLEASWGNVAGDRWEMDKHDRGRVAREFGVCPKGKGELERRGWI